MRRFWSLRLPPPPRQGQPPRAAWRRTFRYQSEKEAPIDLNHPYHLHRMEKEDFYQRDRPWTTRTKENALPARPST